MFKILSTASALPKCRKTNDDLSTFLDTSDEWISQRTGIRERAVCTDETLTDLLTQAANQALERAGITAQELDLILCATIRGDYITPSQACVIQKEIGASCPAMDISAACTGFIYALDVAAGYFARKKVKKVLVLAGDCMTRMMDWSDRSTCVLFGDGAGAVVLGEGENLMAIQLTANGNVDVLNIPHVGGDSPFDKLPKNQSYLSMNGKEVYKFAVSSMYRDVQTVCDQAGVKVEDVDWIVPHQANLRIINNVCKRMHIDKAHVYINIDEYGNTSAASIPLALGEMSEKGLLKPGMKIVLSGFGAGFTWAGCYLEL